MSPSRVSVATVSPSGIKLGLARCTQGKPSRRPIGLRAEVAARFYRAAGYVPLYDGGGIAVKYAGISVDGVLFTVYLVGGTQTVVFERGRY